MDKKSFQTMMHGCDTVHGYVNDAQNAFCDGDIEEARHQLLMAEGDARTLERQIANARFGLDRMTNSVTHS